MPSIRLENVSKSFHLSSTGTGVAEPELEKVALDRVQLAIGSGERVGIVGRNGAGKSTLLHLVAGVATPSSGNISIEGAVTSILTLGLGVREDLSGRENIYLDGEVQGRSRAEVEQVIDEIIAFAELGEFIDYPVRTYSTGMKSRLMFSMISHLKPEILLIDEALSAGDHVFAVKATRRIREICKSGQIVLLVSHSMESIREICERCIWLDAGSVAMDGPVRDVTAAYEQAVQHADEAELLEKVRLRSGSQSLRVGYEIAKVTLRRASESKTRAIVQTGDDIVLEIDCESPQRRPGANLRVVLERLDGLLLMDETLDDALSGQRIEGPKRVSLAFSPFPIGFGVYELTVELISENSTVARSTILFEVVTPNPVRGGRPAIVYPHEITAASA